MNIGVKRRVLLAKGVVCVWNDGDGDDDVAMSVMKAFLRLSCDEFNRVWVRAFARAFVYGKFEDLCCMLLTIETNLEECVNNALLHIFSMSFFFKLGFVIFLC